tara:strand:+ start:328 stop:675 length:348 start_codon:yes stop_codon:yes gene_type:complete
MPKQKTQIEMFAPTEMGKLRTPYQILQHDDYKDLTTEDKEIHELFSNIFESVDSLREDYRIKSRDLVLMFDHYVQSLGGELRNTKSRGEIKSVAEIEASYSSYKDPTFNPRLAVA